VTLFNLTSAEANVYYHIVKPERRTHLKKDNTQEQSGLHVDIAVQPPRLVVRRYRVHGFLKKHDSGSEQLHFNPNSSG
jgi:hypothetical protein